METEKNLIEDLIKEIAGTDILPLYHYINNKLNISEFKIADKLQINVNQVRNMLYRLGQYNLVSSIRKKDKKKGWYIYYWTFHTKEAQALVVTFKKRKIEALKSSLDGITNFQNFVCPNGCMSMSFEDAMEHSFKCSECGKLLKEEEKKKKIEILKKMIKELETS